MKQNKTTLVKAMVTGILLGAMLFILASCNPYKKIQSRLPKNEKEKELLAKVCVDQFPSKSDTLVAYKVDTVYDNADYAELNAIIDSLIIANSKAEKDSNEINQLRERLKELLAEECPPAKTIIKTKETIIKKEDSAKIYIYESKLRQQSVLLYQTKVNLESKTAELSDLKESRKHDPLYNLKWLFVSLLTKWWFWLAGAGVAIYFFRNPVLSIVKNYLRLK